MCGASASKSGSTFNSTPKRIPENPVLETRLEPYETLRMDSAIVLKNYIQPQTMMAMGQPINMNTSCRRKRGVRS